VVFLTACTKLSIVFVAFAHHACPHSRVPDTLQLLENSPCQLCLTVAAMSRRSSVGDRAHKALLEPDFGLRTALNSLDHSSLRALDSLTIEDQTPRFISPNWGR
jgi:hypothetical protein